MARTCSSYQDGSLSWPEYVPLTKMDPSLGKNLCLLSRQIPLLTRTCSSFLPRRISFLTRTCTSYQDTTSVSNSVVHSQESFLYHHELHFFNEKEKAVDINKRPLLLTYCAASTTPQATRSPASPVDNVSSSGPDSSCSLDWYLSGI